jgi:UDPglucose 6-dehydrogenase
MAKRIIAVCDGDVSGMTIAVLGLTFKACTDDLRDAPSLTIIPKLQKAGASIRAFDPEGMPAARKCFTGVTFASDPYECVDGADLLVILTEWEQFRVLDLERLRTALTRPIIVDLRNIYKPAEMRKRGFRYVSVGRPDVDVENPIQRTAPAWGDITAARLGSATMAGESSISN